MSENPFLKRLNKSGKTAHGLKAERKLSKRIAGQLQPGSGALDGAKGDIQKDQFLIEVKSTIHESLSVKRDWLLKVGQEALEKNKLPALAVQFVTENGEPKKNGDWIMIRVRDWEHLLDEDN